MASTRPSCNWVENSTKSCGGRESGREPDVDDQGDATLFRLRQQAQPQHCALDEIITAEIVTVDETGGGQ